MNCRGRASAGAGTIIKPVPFVAAPEETGQKSKLSASRCELPQSKQGPLMLLFDRKTDG